MAALDGNQFASSRQRGDAARHEGVSSWSAVFRDADEQAACISSVYPQSYDQLSSGIFAGEMTTVDLGGVLVVRERVNRRCMQTGVITAVSLGWAWKKAYRYRSNGVEHDDDCMRFYGANEEFEILTDPSEMVAGSLSEQILVDWMECPSALEDPRLFRGLRKVPADIAASLRHAILSALAVADGQFNAALDDLWRDSLRDELLRLVTTVAELPGGVGDRRTRRRERTYERVVRAARDYAMQIRIEDQSLQGMCKHIGVSRRNLHYAFESIMGISPGQYLRSVRLNAARRDIKCWDRSDLSLADIASRWGFWHPSHFAADYKRRFGELPSETAHRAASARESTQLVTSNCT